MQPQFPPPWTLCLGRWVLLDKHTPLGRLLVLKGRASDSVDHGLAFEPWPCHLTIPQGKFYVPLQLSPALPRPPAHSTLQTA